MNLSIWVSFVGTVLILVITPGPSVLLAAANSIKYGSKKAIGTILGDLSANFLQIALASAGLATIIKTSGHLFQFIKWLGVAYLLYMGISKILSHSKLKLTTKSNGPKSFGKLYLEGFLMSAANPKAIVFFAVLFPMFINETHPFLPQVIILAITFLVLDGSSLLFYTHFATKLKKYLEDNKKVHLQNRIVGALLILSGLLLSLVRKT